MEDIKSKGLYGFDERKDYQQQDSVFKKTGDQKKLGNEETYEFYGLNWKELDQSL